MALQRTNSIAPSSATVFGSTFWTGLAEEVVVTLAHSLILFAGLGLTLYAVDPSRASNSAARRNRKKVISKMKENGRIPFEMNDYEAVIAMDMVYPRDIHTTFDDIGGLTETKKEIKNLVCLPLKRLDIFSGRSDLTRPPKGILLYGPPGTGKTMIARAIAKESEAAFINLKVSTLMDKWFGESEKLVKGTFTLAWKLSPCIIFIDELESFLKKRSTSMEHQAVSNMKAEFMSLWDGLNTNLFEQPKKRKSVLERLFSMFSSGEKQNVPSREEKLIKARKKIFGVVVVGATNRPGDIDDAVLRRMARTFLLDLPDETQRLEILKILLEHEALSEDLISVLPNLAKSLVGFSGSDLKELCRAAAVIPLTELASNTSRLSLRELETSDFVQARKKVFPTGHAAKQYQRDLDQKDGEYNFQGNSQLIAALASAMMATVSQPQPKS